MSRYVYDFSEGSAEMRRLLGGKGANLAEMTSIGLPVPDGFTVTTEACLAYLANDGRHPDGLDAELGAHLAALEQRVGKRLGARERPAAGVGAVGRRGLDAGHDGHDPEPGHERRVGAGAGRGRRRRAVRIRLLQAVRADVRGRGRGRRRPPVRERAGADEDGPRRGRRRRPVGRRPAGAGGRVPGDLPAGDRRAISRRIPERSCNGRSTRCSPRGTRRGRAPTVASTTSPTTWAPR